MTDHNRISVRTAVAIFGDNWRTGLWDEDLIEDFGCTMRFSEDDSPSIRDYAITRRFHVRRILQPKYWFGHKQWPGQRNNELAFYGLNPEDLT